ncbi:MAG TPA: signal peptidase I [Candidatus Acidoferrales bacterium]|nr:signal peptidase I [Candidatus Acidoferrales bacterium]
MGLIAVFAIARLALSTRLFAAGDTASPAVATLRSYLDLVIVAGLVALLLVVFVIRPFYIDSISMIPTLQIGDTFLADELTYRLHRPQDGDIAVFTPPVRGARSEFIKRIIGVPGDTIRISDGIVYRNGHPLSEPYENQAPRYDLAIRNYSIYVNGIALAPAQADIPPRGKWQTPDRIPSGFYFVLGDNRNYSEDSHVWGFVRQAGFLGRAFVIIWPQVKVL